MESNAQPANDRTSLLEDSDWLRTRTVSLILFAGIVLMLLAPARWTGNGDIHPWADDPVAYEKIASAAPGFPDGHIASAHSERFVPHYIVGMFNEATGLSLHASYRIFALLTIFATLLVAERIMRTLKPPWWIYAFSLTAFALAPYALRGTILFPAAFQDLVFVLGAGICMLGLLRLQYPLVLIGAFVALSGRQTALLFAAAAAVWMVFAPDWKQKAELRTRLWQGAALVVGLGLTYLVIKHVVKGFTINFSPDKPSDTIIFGPPGLHDLISHLARCMDPIVVPGAALATVLGILAAAGTRMRELPLRLWLSLLLSAAIVVQPVVINPNFPGFSNNEQRLAGLGLLPLCVALAIALIEADRRRLIVPSPQLFAGGMAVLVLSSLHHIFTVVGPSDVKEYAAIQILCGLLLIAGLLYTSRTTPARLARTSVPAPA